MRPSLVDHPRQTIHPGEAVVVGAAWWPPVQVDAEGTLVVDVHHLEVRRHLRTIGADFVTPLAEYLGDFQRRQATGRELSIQHAHPPGSEGRHFSNPLPEFHVVRVLPGGFFEIVLGEAEKLEDRAVHIGVIAVSVVAQLAGSFAARLVAHTRRTDDTDDAAQEGSTGRPRR